MDRHFAYFDQNTGAWIRECRGPVPDPDIDTRLVGDARLGALNTWQQRIAPAGQDEVGLDVTHIGWPVGDFCYCAFDPVTRLLDWGPERFYIEIEMMALEVVANQRSHRPIRDAAPGQRVLDITGTWLEQYHGNIYGRFVRQDCGWAFLPSSNQMIVPDRVRQALAETPFDVLAVQFAVKVPVGQQVR